MSNNNLTPLGSALAGALGACFSNAVVYPLDTVKTRLQALPPSQDAITTKPRTRLGRIRRLKMVNMLLRIIQQEGLQGAFKGFTANMLNTFSMQFAYFFFHTLLRATTVKRLQSSNRSTKLSTASELALGAAAGGLAQIFTIPVSVIATRQQLWTPVNSTDKHSKSAPSLIQVGREIVKEHGVQGLWTGLKPGLILTANPAITYGVFERMKSAVLSGGREGGVLGVVESFWIGVVSKAIATVVTYPYIFAKVRLQAGNADYLPTVDTTGASYATIASQPPSEDAAVPSNQKYEEKQSETVHVRHSHGAIPLLKAVYKREGVSGWYRGLTAQILKAALCQGILFVSKAQFEKWAWVIIAVIGTLRARLSIK